MEAEIACGTWTDRDGVFGRDVLISKNFKSSTERSGCNAKFASPPLGSPSLGHNPAAMLDRSPAWIMKGDVERRPGMVFRSFSWASPLGSVRLTTVRTHAERCNALIVVTGGAPEGRGVSARTRRPVPAVYRTGATGPCV